MVTTGFSRVHVAEYAVKDGVPGYSGCKELARAKSMSVEISATDDNNFYVNNQLSETEPASFSDGTAKIVVDGLSGEEEAFVLGIKESTMQIGGESVPVVKFGKAMNPPYMGIGAVKRMQMNGVPSYRPIILTKARFAIPPEAAETQEDKINWQTQELTATLMRDDSAEANWKIIPKENFDTEEKAVAFIKAVLGGAA